MGGNQSVVTCNFSTVASAGDTCQSFASNWGLTLSGFQDLNPGVSCPNLVAGQDTSPPAATSTPPTTSTTSSSPYSPAQPGLVANCNKFYRVSSGDTCEVIEAKYGISLAQFLSWNQSVHQCHLTHLPDCNNLWLDYFVCVGVPGAITTAPPPVQTPTGPQPQMPAIVSNCRKFRLVLAGDNCWTIDNAEGISLAQFLSWNPYVDSQCGNLWQGYYVCVGV
ncbi:hypothetical protein CONLIGDRAFT_655072 [Coniochaeta ligniaria NRRL 30616]|uniref:LysM domain-containing protein n=1 Tax=Coniochaeta ligniaria NRRL 30616 TaxID=1408157 RepID=A0A1J7IPE8_9PEZI|nr:hypothetical protein CONLIGDRAFT_655072 [Coniochaeta ligniaria NRRL 30616]